VKAWEYRRERDSREGRIFDLKERSLGWKKKYQKWGGKHKKIEVIWKESIREGGLRGGEKKMISPLTARKTGRNNLTVKGGHGLRKK